MKGDVFIQMLTERFRAFTGTYDKPLFFRIEGEAVMRYAPTGRMEVENGRHIVVLEPKAVSAR